MQGNRGLAAAGNALHKDQIVEGVTDNHVLLALDGFDNRFHLLGSVVRQRLAEHIVDDIDIRIEEVVEGAVLDVVLALERDLAADGAGGSKVLDRAGLIAVEQAGNRGAPVIDKGLVAVLVLDGGQSDVDFFGRVGFVAILGEVHSGKIGSFQRLTQVVDALVGGIVAGRLRLNRFQRLMGLDCVVKAAAERDGFPHLPSGGDDLVLLVGAGLLLTG